VEKLVDLYKQLERLDFKLSFMSVIHAILLASKQVRMTEKEIDREVFKKIVNTKRISRNLPRSFSRRVHFSALRRSPLLWTSTQR